MHPLDVSCPAVVLSLNLSKRKNILLNHFLNFRFLIKRNAGPSGRAVEGVGLRSLSCWACGLESRRGHGCLSIVSVVCCQVEVSALG